MKIVSRTTLMGLPAGTLYCEYTPCIFGDWHVKGRTLTHAGKNIDWYFDTDMTSFEGDDHFATLHAMEKTGCSVPLTFEGGGRDGGFDDDQLYAVYEPADLNALIARLQQAALDCAKGGAQ